ncbi:MAG: FMN-binding negative transcriptional regulator [Saprospiraceae bacterium]|nr:FMN-binding negative transcriptional regulator [Saprospiraceae bacterium]
MYIPSNYRMTDKASIIEFIKKFSFATIITAKDGRPVATHLPFLVSEINDTIILTSHFAKANPQWHDIENLDILVIFSEPHAYISPKHYEKLLNVPTWNYLSVHLYGKCKIIKESQAIISILENTIHTYDEAYKSQWDGLPEVYKSAMINGIVAFRITVNSIEAKKKLSQNKTETEQKNIIKDFSESKDQNEQYIANYMLKNLEK